MSFTNDIPPKPIYKANSRQVGGDHYKTGGTELWDLFGPGALAFYAARYVQRWRRKNGVLDLEKAVHVCEKLREVIKGKYREYGGGVHFLVQTPEVVDLWLKNSGMDWVECSIVRKLLYWETTRDIAEAIDGIRYLIEREKNKEIVLPNTAPLDELMARAREHLVKQDRRVVVTNTPRAGESTEQTMMRERRVPRYDADVKHTDVHMQRLAECARHVHAPWVVTDDWLTRSGIERNVVNEFWTMRAPGLYVLEPHVEGGTPIPTALTECYDECVLDIRKCPPEVRDYFPSLEQSIHAKQHDDETPKWQRALYAWSAEKNKYELTDMTSAWHVEPEDE